MINKHKPFINLYLMVLLLVLLLVAIFIWQSNTNLTLGFTDNAYHLGVAEGFSRAGGITTWDFWNSLPTGRPQNYPPLFHLIFADLLKMGVNSEIALKLMMELFVVGGLAFFALGIAKIYNLRAACWSVIILAISIRFICASVTIMPSAMVLFLSPLLFHFFKEKKWISYVALLTLMLYLHLFLPLIILFALALYTLFDKKLFFPGLKASLIALLLYSPWLIHIFSSGISSIKYFDSSFQITRYQIPPQINLIFVSLTIIALLFLVIKKKIIKNDCYFLILLLMFCTMAFFATERSLSGHLWIFIALFISLFLDRFISKIRILPYVASTVFIVALFIMPYLVFDRGVYLDFYQPTVFKTVLKNTYNFETREQKYQKLFSDMKNNSAEGESVGTALNYFDRYAIDQREYQSNVAIYFSANSNRPTMNLYQPEYLYRPLPNLSESRLVLLNEKQDNLTPQYFIDFGYSSSEAKRITESITNNFTLISVYQSEQYFLNENSEIENDNKKDVYLYKNKNESVTTETLPKFVFPFWLANSILVLLIGLILLNDKKIK